LTCINVNTFPYPIITKFVLPKILQRNKKGKKGAVITISSVGADAYAVEGLGIYVATKAFNLRFS